MIHDYSIAFIFWNVFLALVPCAIAWFLYNKKLPLPGFVALFVIWFFFFPNTAYLFTEVRHLVDYCAPDSSIRICPNEAWIPPLFFLYASIGIPTFIYALDRMSCVLSRFKKPLKLWFPILMIPATSIGVLLGLVDRFNSWDIATNPLYIARVGFGYLIDPVMLRNVIAYSVLLYFIYFFIPKTFRYVQYGSRGSDNSR